MRTTEGNTERIFSEIDEEERKRYASEIDWTLKWAISYLKYTWDVIGRQLRSNTNFNSREDSEQL